MLHFIGIQLGWNYLTQNNWARVFHTTIFYFSQEKSCRNALFSVGKTYPGILPKEGFLHGTGRRIAEILCRPFGTVL